MTAMVVKLVTAGVAVTAIILAGLLPALPRHEREDLTIAVTPAPLPRACPGQLTVPVGDIDPGDPDLAPSAPSTVFSVLSSVNARDLVDGDGSWFDDGVAASWEQVDRGDVAGIAAVACTAPATSQWLVGGSTSIGSSSRLVLTNPTRAAVDVVVTVYGPVGRVEHQATVVVAAFGQSSVLIEAIEVAVPGIVVHVASTGRGVVAAMQDSRLDGIQPAGTDWIMPVADAHEELIIPVVGSANPEAVSTVRLLAPEGAVATLTLVSDEGIEPWGGTSRIVLDPGVVVDVEVPSFAVSGVEVRADAPVVAAARTVVPRPATEGLMGDVAHDHRWVAGLPVIRQSVGAIAGYTETQVWLYATTEGTVVFTDALGAPVATVETMPRTITVANLNVLPGTALFTDAAVVWSLALESDLGFLSVIQPIATETADVTVVVADVPYTGR